MTEPREYEYAERTTDAPPEVRQYRNPSVLAGLTTILGLLSIAALASTSLWFIPWITVLLGVVTLFLLAHHPEKMGRRPVIVALALAVFVGVLAPAKLYSRQIWLQTKAKVFAQEWFGLVLDNKLDLAFQLHLPRSQRVEPDTSFDEYYKKIPGIKVEYDAFLGSDAVRSMIDHRQTATLTYERLAGYLLENEFDSFNLRYRLEFDDNGKTKQAPILIEVVRIAEPRNDVHDWYVRRVDYPVGEAPK